MTTQRVYASHSLYAALSRKGNVMKAVILRDMRTRFFNHGLGFIIVPLWPLAHLVILLTLYHVMNRAAPYGSSLNIFFATGLIPTLSFLYISRHMALSLLSNRAMLGFAVIRPGDILIGRAALELIGVAMMVFLTFILLVALGDDPYPFDPGNAALALLTAIVAGVGAGMTIGVLCIIFRAAITLYYLLSFVLWILSGTLFVASALPAPLAHVLSFNPLTHYVEWMRIAYIPGYPDQFLDRTYAVGFALCLVFSGLLAERLLRPALLGK